MQHEPLKFPEDVHVSYELRDLLLRMLAKVGHLIPNPIGLHLWTGKLMRIVIAVLDTTAMQRGSISSWQFKHLMAGANRMSARNLFSTDQGGSTSASPVHE